MERLLTIDELSDKLQIGKSTIYRWVRWDFVPYIKIGGVLRFEEGKVRGWLKQRGCAGSSRLKAKIEDTRGSNTGVSGVPKRGET